jgi:hypothetical protein
MNALPQHIRSLNEKTQACVNEDPEHRFAALPVEDALHWLSYGIETPEQFDHYMLVSNVFEATRSAYGYKPSWVGLENLSNEQLEAEMASLSKELKRIAAEEAEQAKQDALRAEYVKDTYLTHRTGFAIAELVSL